MGFCIVMKLWQYSRLLHQNQSFFDYLNWRLVREACALSLHEVTWLGVKNLKVFYFFCYYYSTTCDFCVINLLVEEQTNKILGICKLIFFIGMRGKLKS